MMLTVVRLIKKRLNKPIIRLVTLSTSFLFLVGCGPLGSLIYQGQTTNLGPFQVDSTITGSIVGTQIALSGDGQTLVSEDWRRRVIYRKFGGNWPQVYSLDYRPTTSPADDKGTPWFSPKLDATGTTLLTSDRDKLRTFMPQATNAQNWQAESFLNSALDSESYRYSKALLSDDASIVVLSHKTSNNGSFTVLDKDITIWEQSSGNWSQIAAIERLANSGESTNFNAANFGLELVGISSDGSRILVVGPNGAFVHSRSGDSWQNKAQLTATTTIFGFNEKGALNNSGNRIAIEANTNSDGPRVLIFDLTNNAWQQSSNLKGEFMAMSGDGQTLVLQNFVQTGSDFIGTPQSQGFLEIYRASAGSWQKVATFAPASDRNKYQRVALSRDGSVLAATLQDPPFSTGVRLEIYSQ